MAASRLSRYLCRRPDSDRFYFRIAVPPDLREAFGRIEIRRSLHTSVLEIAETTVDVLASRTQRLFRKIRTMSLSNEQIHELVETYYQELLDADELARKTGRRLSRNDEEDYEQWEQLHGEWETLDERLRTWDPVAGRDMADRVIREKGLDIETDSNEYHALRFELLKAERQATAVFIDRLADGNKAADDDFAGQPQSSRPGHSAISTASVGGRTAEKSQGPAISQASEELLTEKSGTGVSGKQIENLRTIYALLVEIVGDRPVADVTRVHVVQFRDTVSQLPAHRNKKPEFRDKSVAEILQMPGLKPLADKTVNEHVKRVCEFLNWAVDAGYRNLPIRSAGIVKKKTPGVSGDREPYSRDELQIVVNNLPDVVGSGRNMRPERFWIPLVAMYSGARMNDICQLDVGDIQEIDDIWCIQIQVGPAPEKTGKRVKTDSSRRTVPIHPELSGLGFLDYVRSVKQKRLWPKLKAGPHGNFSHYFTKWYGEKFNRPLISDDPKKVFHSFRHNVADALKQRGDVPREVVQELLGHKTESITYDTYGTRYGVKPLYEAVCKIDYGLDLFRLNDAAKLTTSRGR
jgi:integrase